MAINKKKIAVFLLLLISKVFANELYNDNKTSLSVEELSKGEFEIVYSYSNERLELHEISPTGYNSYWISDDILRLDFGSPFAPDVRSYFFSKRIKKISSRKNFATAIVDLKNYKILCADIEITVEDLFSDNKKIVSLPNAYVSACKFFIVDDKSFFINNNLILFYLANDETIKGITIKLD
ncbi:MAG: hypothetical protein IJ530_10025 [Treponema sp.]|uniref:hypothetical protein n=1 Tax=Treponema sp. TaxID=166 RepID=UPI0025DEC305|nr:hypothetical protein [Treponema sp.]MBQ8680085.1 hypothetical protein [Treponema sp.]